MLKINPKTLKYVDISNIQYKIKIEFQKFPLNFNDKISTEDIYKCYIKFRKIIIPISYIWRKSDIIEIIQIGKLIINGTDGERTYTEKNSNLVDGYSYIDESFFIDSIKPLSIKLNKVIFHNYDFFESYDYTFKTSDKISLSLYDFIINEINKEKDNLIKSM